MHPPFWKERFFMFKGLFGKKRKKNNKLYAPLNCN